MQGWVSFTCSCLWACCANLCARLWLASHVPLPPPPSPLLPLRPAAGLEGRVIFQSFAPYIALPPPWNYVAVTAALMGLSALVVAHLAGLLGNAHDLTLASVCLLLCTAAGGLVMGVPLQWMPAPLLAACGLALFYESRSLREYAAFVVGSLLSATWFVWHHFWFLHVRVGHVHLHTLCKMALAAVLPALLVPGLVLAGVGHQVVGVLLLIQAELLCVMEEQMYVAPAGAAASGDVMYPAYLVIATSAAGIAVAQAMHNAGHVPRWASWVVSTLYGAKLSMLLLPEAYLVMPVGLLLLAATAPIYMHEPIDRKRKVRLAPWQGLAHAAAVVIALALARFAVFDVVAWAVNGRPSEGVLLGALLLVAAVALGPLVVHCYSHNQVGGRCCQAIKVGILPVGHALTLKTATCFCDMPASPCCSPFRLCHALTQVSTVHVIFKQLTKPLSARLTALKPTAASPAVLRRCA